MKKLDTRTANSSSKFGNLNKLRPPATLIDYREMEKRI